MHTPDTALKPTGWLICGGILLAALAGCEPEAAGDPPKPLPTTETGPIGTGVFGSSEPLGGVLFLPSGRIVVVDAKGSEITPCRLPGPESTPDGAADAGECQKVRGTTITNIQSISVVRHTGSQCITVETGQTVSGGQFIPGVGVYQICF